ncbi:MAG: histidinol dehydrogenase [Rhodospirillales bacterium]
MALRLDAGAPDFHRRFDAFVAARREAPADVRAVVARILSDIRARGDAALLELTKRLDRLNAAEAAALRVGEAEIEAAAAQVPAETMAALDLAASRIEEFHRRQRPEDARWRDEAGVTLGWRWTPIAAVGIYVPGGAAADPSSVLMNASPARVAGVERVAMTVPAPAGLLSPLVLAAARRAGVNEIWRIGGAQAVAALAFGTETIKPVDKIVGPGNAYVAEAKRQVFGAVGIDAIAGPSEILVVADRNNDPDWIAADLLSQAEHDPAAQCVLIADDAAFAGRVEQAVERLLKTLARRAITERSWRENGAVIVVEDVERDAPGLVDALAPEHVELAVADPETLARRLRNVGAVFLGRHTPEAIGDYVAGSNHVLPTSRAARYASGLSVPDFMKRTAIVGCQPDSARAIGPAAVALAEAEGLGAHALSVRLRLNSK